MSGCTPDTGKVQMAYRDFYCADIHDPAHSQSCPEDLEFGLWLDEIKAAAWHEGFCRGEQSGLRELPLNPREWNPYRKDNA